jgi:Mn2+/Fe2+ NRAMP family transporter
LSHHWREAQFFYGVIALSTLAGLAINFIGINPIQALLYAAIINCVAAVPFVAFVLVLANKKEIMGIYKNNLFLNIMGAVTLVFASSGLLIELHHPKSR